VNIAANNLTDFNYDLKSILVLLKEQVSGEFLPDECCRVIWDDFCLIFVA
jgi:hypothetical protein